MAGIQGWKPASARPNAGHPFSGVGRTRYRSFSALLSISASVPRSRSRTYYQIPGKVAFLGSASAAADALDGISARSISEARRSLPLRSGRNSARKCPCDFRRRATRRMLATAKRSAVDGSSGGQTDLACHGFVRPRTLRAHDGQPPGRCDALYAMQRPAGNRSVIYRKSGLGISNCSTCAAAVSGVVSPTASLQVESR